MPDSLYWATVIVERGFFRFGASALFLLGAGTLFFWPILIDGRVPVFRDILDTTVPLGRYIGERLREGKLPQWFPYEGLGEPFIGQLNESSFHPASWLYAVLPLAAALRWQLLLGYAAGAFGQLLLARKLGVSATASALAAVVFAFSGYGISLSNLLPYLWGMASLPWLGLFAAEICTRERPWPWVASLAICWATVVLAGDSHSALFGGLVVLFVGAVTGGLRRLPLCVLSSLLAVGIAGAELLPAIDLVRAGPRGLWTDSHNLRLLSSQWSLHPYRLPELVLPGWIPPSTAVLFSNERYREGSLWALSIFVGVPAVALAAAGLFSRTRRGLLAGGLAIVGLWLALGLQGGLEPALRRVLPILNLLRYPEKHLALFTFGLSLAAGEGLDRLRKKPVSWTVPIALACVATVSLGAALLLPGNLAQRIWPRLKDAPLHIQQLHDAWHHALLATAAAAGAASAILAAERGRPGAIAWLPLSVFVELWIANGATIGVAPASVLSDVPRLCESARRAGAGPDGLRVVNASTRSRIAEQLESAVSWAATSRNLLLPDSSALCGIGSFWEWPILTNEPRVLREVLGHEVRNPALQLYGFGLIIRAQPEDKPLPDETVIDGVALAGKVLLLARRPAAPRAYVATPRWAPDATAARRVVQELGLALTDEPVLIGSGPDLAGQGAVGTVHIAAYEPEHVVLEAQMDRPGAVILNDLDSPGWTATLDGAPARIYNANALVRGVLVPAGAHRIEMVYALPRLRSGLALSGTSLLLCALLGATALLRRRSPADERALQRAYWNDDDRAHYLWQTGNPYIAATEARLLDSVALREGGLLLEIGCGEGANLSNLAPRLGGAAPFAVDLSLAKARFVATSGARAACADATSLPFRDGAFDAVLIRDLLHHVPDRPRVLAEAARLLRPGGRLTVIEPNGRNPIIVAMALAVRAERGMLASSPKRAVSEAAAAGLIELRVEERQPLPLSRVVLHYRLGAPCLARFSSVRAVLQALEKLAGALPRSLWSYFLLTAVKPES